MLGEKIRNLRSQKGITQKELGKALNLSQQTIDHYENNRSRPSLETLSEMVKFFGCTYDYFFGKEQVRYKILADGSIAEARGPYEAGYLSIPNVDRFIEDIKITVYNAITKEEIEKGEAETVLETLHRLLKFQIEEIKSQR